MVHHTKASAIVDCNYLVHFILFTSLAHNVVIKTLRLLLSGKPTTGAYKVKPKIVSTTQRYCAKIQKVNNNFSETQVQSNPNFINIVIAGYFKVMSLNVTNQSINTEVTDIEEGYEWEEEIVLESDLEDSVNRTITNFGQLVVDKYTNLNEQRNKILNLDNESTESKGTSDGKALEAKVLLKEREENTKSVSELEPSSDAKRSRSVDDTPTSTPNPKRHRAIKDMLPSMADVLKADDDGYVVDIIALQENSVLNRDQCELIKSKITAELFSMDDISNIKFEPPYFDGSKLRIICKNEISKKWLLDTVLKLEKQIDGIEIGTKEIGVPPKMLMVSFSMPVKTYEPAVLFNIIAAQNSIDTTFWRYRSRSKVSNGRQNWLAAVDEPSFTQLKTIGYRPFVGLDRIKFNPVNEHKK